ncbi:MAG TPA: AAA family ATPase [Flavobacterium lutivivi]|nr:AAA family ATPase [Flavobacterium lutivivi]
MKDEIYDFTVQELDTKKYDLAKYILQFSSEIQEPIPILKQDDKLVISRGNISVIAGAPKSKKSMFVSALVASFYGSEAFGFTSYIKGGKCLLFDTESAESHTLKQIKRIYSLLGWTKQEHNLTVFYLRGLETEIQTGIIKQAIKDYRPDWVVIDGLLDLVNSANDETESKTLILELMKLTVDYDCHITSILHTGKSNNGQMLGFLGSFAQRKSETVFQLTVDGKETKVIPAETRNAPFEEFSFIINEFGIPVYCGLVERKTKQEMNDYNMKLFFTKLLAPAEILDYDKLAHEYSELAGCSERTSKSHISKMRKINFIRKVDSGGYCLTGID